MAVVGAFAANGEKLFASLTAGWQWLLLVSDKMPLGVWSFALALASGCVAMGLLRRFTGEPESKGGMHGRLSIIELAAMAVTFLVGYSQYRELLGAIFSLMAAGLVSPIFRLIAALWDLILSKLGNSNVADGG